VFEDPAKVPSRFTEINRITEDMVPPELMMKQTGQPGHFEIVPREPMSPARFLQLLKDMFDRGEEPVE
jgi:hypothetical protein